MNDEDAYEKCSLDKVNDPKLMMTHLSSYVKYAREYYEGYLTEDELQEKQYEGRFWDLVGFFLYILFDNDTVVVIEPDNKDVYIYGRYCLPQSLVGCYYE